MLKIGPAHTRIEYKDMTFLITDQPSDATMQSYLMVCLEMEQASLSLEDLKQWFNDWHL